MKLRITCAAAALVLLGGCASTAATSVANTAGSGGSSAAGSGSATASSGASASPSPSPTPLGPAVPAATTVAQAVPAAELPTSTGRLGDKPSLTFPSAQAPAGLQREVLTEGTGPVVAKGDFLVTNYLGQIWNGKVFDNSYDKKTPLTFQVGGDGIVSGWSVGLLGVKAGSRVLLSLPPSSGYGSGGSAGAGISGTDTIVFVIDVKSDIPTDATGQKDAVLQTLPAGLPTVTGAPGREPVVTIPKGLAEPKADSVQIIAKGTGAPVAAGSVIAQLVVTDWTQSQTTSTWPASLAAPASSAAPSSAGETAADAGTKGAQEVPIAASGPTAALIGVPIGSRVMLLVAASSDASTGQSSAAAVAVLDIVAQK